MTVDMMRVNVAMTMSTSTSTVMITIMGMSVAVMIMSTGIATAIDHEIYARNRYSGVKSGRLEGLKRYRACRVL